MLNIVGGVCLLLWGLRSVKLGMIRAFGADLHKFVAAGTNNRIKAFFSGLFVTTLLQSSTATALIVSTFCGRALMGLSAGLAVMLGADVGTTLVAQLLTFKVTWLAPLLLFVGFVTFSAYDRKGRMEHVGRFILGLGFMLFALGTIKEAALPLSESETLKSVLVSLERDPVLAVLLTALLTWVAHSSLAVVLLLASFVTADILPLNVAVSMVLGANLGGGLAPLFATLRGPREGCRVPMGNLLMRLVGVVAAIPAIELFSLWSPYLGADETRAVLNFHTGFNIALALAFLPLTGFVARICEKILPAERSDERDPGLPKYLDERQIHIPAVALSSAMRETLRMAEIVQAMLGDALLALQRNDESFVHEIRKRDDVLDRLYKEVKMYMARLALETMDAKEAAQYVRILSFATNIENIGDTLDKSLMEMAHKKIQDKTRFSVQGWKEIQDIHTFVMDTARLAQSVFVTGDTNLARQLVEGKDKIRIQESKTMAAHFDRIREGVPETIATSSLHLDIIRDLRRINSYFATVGFPILEEAGMLQSNITAKKPSAGEKPAAESLPEPGWHEPKAT